MLGALRERLARPAGTEPPEGRPGTAPVAIEGRERLLPWALAAAIFAVHFTLALLRSHRLGGGYDQGYFLQASWLISHGKYPFVTIEGLHVLGDHAVLIFYPVALLTRLLPAAVTLLGLQAGALALGAVPLYAIARRLAGLPVKVSVVLLVAYGLHPAVANIGVGDFHPISLAVPALFGAVLFGLTQRWWPYAACVAVALLCKEDVGLIVASLGVFLLLSGAPKRAALLTIVAGLAMLFIDTRLIQRHFAGGIYYHALNYEQYGRSLGEVAWNMLTHPGRVARDLLIKDNWNYAVAILGPLLFLPVMAPRYLIPGLPLQLLYLLSGTDTAHTVLGQYPAVIIPFLFIAAAMALGKRQLRELRVDRAFLTTLVAAALVFNTAFGIDGVGTWPWEPRSRDDLGRARAIAARLIPPNASVTASERMWPHVARRQNVYSFPAPFRLYRPRRDPLPLTVRQEQTRYMVIDTRDESQWGVEQHQTLVDMLPEWGFQKIFERDGVVIFRR